MMAKLFKVVFVAIALIFTGYAGYTLGIDEGVRIGMRSRPYEPAGYIIYKWRDAQGLWHYSDQDPEKSLALEVKSN